MPFNDRSLIRSLKGETYGDLLQVHWFSGSDALTAAPVAFSGPGGISIPDAWGRRDINTSRVTIASGSLILSGTWNWSAAIDRRPFPAGMLEEADGVFVCFDENFQVLSGAQIFASKDGNELELVRMITGLTTGEVFTAWRKQREVR